MSNEKSERKYKYFFYIQLQSKFTFSSFSWIARGRDGTWDWDVSLQHIERMLLKWPVINEQLNKRLNFVLKLLTVGQATATICIYSAGIHNSFQWDSQDNDWEKNNGLFITTSEMWYKYETAYNKNEHSVRTHSGVKAVVLDSFQLKAFSQLTSNKKLKFFSPTLGRNKLLS